MAGPAPEPVSGGAAPPAGGRLFRLRVLVAVGFGSGLAPKAPGTFGTAGAVVCFLPFAPLAAGHPLLYAVTVAGLTMIAVWAAEAAETHFRRHDAGHIVIDEFVGFFATMFLVPANVRTLALAFVLFRVFDIAKIPPARQIDRRMPGGFGVVLDDLISGIYANLAMQLAMRLFPGALDG